MATPISTTRGALVYGYNSAILMRLSKVCFTCCGNGKVLFSSSEFILSENDIHCEWYKNIPTTRHGDFMSFEGCASRSDFIRFRTRLTSPCDIR